MGKEWHRQSTYPSSKQLSHEWPLSIPSEMYIYHYLMNEESEIYWLQTFLNAVFISTIYLVIGSEWSFGLFHSIVAFLSLQIIESIGGQRGTSKYSLITRDRRKWIDDHLWHWVAYWQSLCLHQSSQYMQSLPNANLAPSVEKVSCQWSWMSILKSSFFSPNWSMRINILECSIININFPSIDSPRVWDRETIVLYCLAFHLKKEDNEEGISRNILSHLYSLPCFNCQFLRRWNASEICWFWRDWLFNRKWSEDLTVDV